MTQDLQTIDKQQHNITPASSTQLTTYQSATINKRVKALFINFAAVYGHKWTSPIADPQVLLKTIAAWESAVSDLTDEQLRIAMRKFTRCEEWVSIAGFRKAALGIMGTARAFEARETDGLARQAWQSIPSFDRDRMTETDARIRFAAAYDAAAEKLLLGDSDEMLR